MPHSAVDTTVVVGAVSTWHAHHDRCRRALDAALAEPPVVLAQHVLLEAYSVLTRLPAPKRLDPSTALRVLTETLSEGTRILDLPAADSWSFLSRLDADDVAGGSVYDAFILRCAIEGGARRILTLNARHFERLAPSGFEVVVP